jgi:hypothetical protein
MNKYRDDKCSIVHYIVRTFFSQSNTSRWQAGQDGDRSLQQVIDVRIKSQLPLHPAYIAKIGEAHVTLRGGQYQASRVASRWCNI